jgi:hypothetical protein
MSRELTLWIEDAGSPNEAWLETLVYGHIS